MKKEPFYPKKPGLVSLRSMQQQLEVLPKEVETKNVLDIAKDIYEAPLYSISGTGNSASQVIEGEIWEEALRSKSGDLWDVESGDSVEIKVFESGEDPEIYEGHLDLVDHQERSDEWEKFTGIDVASNYFEEGGILVEKKPQEMKDGFWKIYFLDVEKAQNYESAIEKLDSIFPEPEKDTRLAKRYLTMDYKQFSNGRMF